MIFKKLMKCDVSVQIQAEYLFVAKNWNWNIRFNNEKISS